MGLDILDLMFRLERHIGIRIERGEIYRLFEKNEPPDVRVGELFDFVRSKSKGQGVLDDEVDADSMWTSFSCAVCEALGVEPEEITKDKWLIQELGAG
jgi:hypothetical protein